MGKVNVAIIVARGGLLMSESGWIACGGDRCLVKGWMPRAGCISRWTRVTGDSGGCQRAVLRTWNQD